MTVRNARLEKDIYPGAGAAAFARAIVAGLSEEEAAPIVEAILERRYHDANNKRVKDCAFCGYPYRDFTKPNNSKTCSPECKKGLDAEKKREKRAEEKTANPNRSYTITERHYAVYDDMLEYPFWNAVGKRPSDSIMDAVFYRHESPYDNDSLANIDATMQTRERIGGRRKITTEKEY